ncbi:MAG TPA: tail fiber domain-containing protein [Bacteroidia bacterium]
MKTKTTKLLILALFFCGMGLFAQTNKSVGIGTTTPNQSAVLHLESNNQGFIMPHLTNTQIIAITSPMNGLIVYSTTDSCYWFYKANRWDKICGTQHIVANYIKTDTLIANTATIDSLITHYINTYYIHATTIVTNSITSGVGSFDTLLINGQTIHTVITNELDTTAWLVKGNMGTNPAVNFLGSKDTASIVVRTNNLERVRILGSNGNVGIGTSAPTNNLDINGGIRVRPGAALNYVLLSDANGNGTWQNPMTTILTYTTIGNYAWELLGNTGTNPTINFLGSTDTASLVVRTHNIERMRVSGSNGFVGVNTSAPTNNLDINGGIRVRPGAALNYVLLSDANGNGTWQNSIGTILTYTSIGIFAWELNGNGGTNPSINFLGTTDAQNLTIRTNSVSVFTFNTAGQLRSTNNGTAILPVYTFGANANSGMWYNPTDFSINLNTPSYMSSPFQGYVSANFGSNINIIPRSLIGYVGTGLTNTISATESANCVIGQRNYLNNGSGAVGNMIYGNLNKITGSVLSSIFGFDNTLSASDNSITIGFLNSVINNTYGTVTGYSNTVSSSGGTYVVGATNTVTSGAYVVGVNWNITHNSACAFGVSGGIGSFAISGLQLAGAGGTRVYSNGAGTAGVALAAGGGAWAAISDRKLKENITEIKTEDVLSKLLSVPVTEWNYITQPIDTMNKYAPKGVHYDKAPVHIGPMAQDFWAAFGYGEFTDKITSTDIDGVMFSAIQALAAKQKDMETLTTTVSDLQKQMAEMKAAIEEIKRK